MRKNFLISFIIVMLFVFLGLAACASLQNASMLKRIENLEKENEQFKNRVDELEAFVILSEQKSSSKTEISDYAKSKGQENYTKDNWHAVESIIMEYILAIEKATDKDEINLLVSAAKEAIDDIPDNPFVQTIAEGMVEFRNWNSASSRPFNIIVIWFEDEGAIFECNATDGYLIGIYPYDKSLTVISGEEFAWDTSHILPEQTFIEIIARVDGNIVGYAVIEIYTDAFSYNVRVLISNLIPQIDGKYQNVTEKQIHTAIEKVKK